MDAPVFEAVLVGDKRGHYMYLDLILTYQLKDKTRHLFSRPFFLEIPQRIMLGPYNYISAQTQGDASVFEALLVGDKTAHYMYLGLIIT
jgi:hypothetical protein